MSETFDPTEATRERLRNSGQELSNAAMDEFFALWETEGDPRKAGSIVAHRYVIQAAKIAAFGAVCAGQTPRRMDSCISCLSGCYPWALHGADTTCARLQTLLQKLGAIIAASCALQ